MKTACDGFGDNHGIAREREGSMAELLTAALVYPAMRTFTDRCLVNDLSLLWPTEPVWTLETLEPVKERFVVGALFGDDRRFDEKLRLQFEPLPDQCWRLFADALVVYSLPSLFGAASRATASIPGLISRPTTLPLVLRVRPRAL
jgi:hypothetical protein